MTSLLYCSGFLYTKKMNKLRHSISGDRLMIVEGWDMDKKEMLDYLSEKKQLTAPVATAENNVRAAEAGYEKARKKWKWGINILIVLVVLFIWYFLTGDRRLFYFDENHTFQAGGLGGIILFGGILLLLLYVKSRRYTNPAKGKLAEAQNILQQGKNKPDYRNGLKNFPEKFYNYSALVCLWKIINEERAESLKEAYNLLEMQQFQEDQMAIQEDIRRLQQETATASKVNAAASVVTAYNTAQTARRLRK